MSLNKNWNGTENSELEEIAEKSESDKAFRDAMEELHKAKQKLKNSAEVSRIKAGNKIMNFITEYFLEQQKLYRDDFGHNYIDAMRADELWNIQDEKFIELLRDYFEYTVGE
jgi:hypothetical protein